MFENITQAYDKTDATWEIIIMLAVAFLLGMLVHWAFTSDDECCHSHEKNPEKHPESPKKILVSRTVSVGKTTEETKKKVVAPLPKKTVSVSKKVVKSEKDNLRLIDGVGPKIEKILNDAGIKSFSDLSVAKKAMLDTLLEKAGPRFQMHDPATWSAQAKKLMKK